MEVELREKYFLQLEKEIQELVDKKTGLLADKYSKQICCPLCSASYDLHEMLFVKNGYTFVRCQECGMIFTNPQVKEEFLNEIHGVSVANDLWVEVQKSDKEKSWKKDYYIDNICLLEKFLDYRNNISLLDIGCSTGYFLEVLREIRPDWPAKGLEICEKAFNIALSKGLNVEKKMLHQLGHNEKYILFTMFGVLEYLSNPQKILKDIINTAEKRGCYILVIVPNAYSLYHMFLQSKSVSFDGRNHLLYFSEVTLKRLFIEQGFKVLHIDTVLTGLSNIMRQIQWFDPYSEVNTGKYIPEKIKNYFENKETMEKRIQANNLGLRLRILAKYKD